MKRKQLSLNGCSEVTSAIGSFCVKLRCSVDSNATLIYLKVPMESLFVTIATIVQWLHKSDSKSAEFIPENRNHLSSDSVVTLNKVHLVSCLCCINATIV